MDIFDPVVVGVLVVTFAFLCLMGLRAFKPIPNMSEQEVMVHYNDLIDEIIYHARAATHARGFDKQHDHMIRACKIMHKWEISSEEVLRVVKLRDPELAVRLEKDKF